MAINVSERALRELKREIEAGGLSPATTFLRLGVKGGGCSGLSYSLDIETEISPSDKVFEFTLPESEEDAPKLKVLVDPKSYVFLVGSTIEYIEEGFKRGYIVINPNAKSTCGCGSSFQPE